MRGDGPDGVGRDVEGEVDRALGRSGVDRTMGDREPRTVSPKEIREALEQAIVSARGIVALEVRRPGEQALRARLCPVTWGALWDVLHLDPEDEEEDALWPEGKDLPEAQPATKDAAPALAKAAALWAEVQAELARARARFPALHSSHEGLAVLLEEYREVERLVFGQQPLPAALRAELVQVAAMALRMVEDLSL